MKRLAVLSLAACASTPAAPAQSPWAMLATRDLDAVHQILLENHPGPVDAQNPGFKDWLERGRADAQSLAHAAVDGQGYSFALRRYVAGFRDDHVQLEFSLFMTPRWPGFLVGLSAGRYLVRETSGDGPPVGAELVSCDGTAPKERMTRDIFPYEGDERLEASWTALAPLLLVDRGNPSAAAPTRCDFLVEGQPRTVTLAWREIDGRRLNAKIDAAAFGPRPGFAMRRTADDGVWITIPTFTGNDESILRLKEIVSGVEKFRVVRWLVFDVRGNGGGNSSWGQRIAFNLFGEALANHVAERLMPGAIVEWRVSAGNQRHVGVTLVAQAVEQFGTLSREAISWRVMASGIGGALAAGKPLYSAGVPDEAPKAQDAPPSPVTAKIYLLTDGRCMSACLDFADVLLAFPGVTHVGLPTYADTQYMDVRTEVLPSQVARVVFPMKVWRGRPRGSKPYVPSARFDGDISDTGAVETWLHDLFTGAGRR